MLVTGGDGVAQLEDNMFSLEELRKNRIKTQPLQTGIYFLFLGDEIIYIGSTNCLHRRLGEHSFGRAHGTRLSDLRKVFDSYIFIPYEDTVLMLEDEFSYITQFKPPYNKNREDLLREELASL